MHGPGTCWDPQQLQWGLRLAWSCLCRHHAAGKGTGPCLQPSLYPHQGPLAFCCACGCSRWKPNPLHLQHRRCLAPSSRTARHVLAPGGRMAGQCPASASSQEIFNSKFFLCHSQQARDRHSWCGSILVCASGPTPAPGVVRSAWPSRLSREENVLLLFVHSAGTGCRHGQDSQPCREGGVGPPQFGRTPGSRKMGPGAVHGGTGLLSARGARGPPSWVPEGSAAPTVGMQQLPVQEWGPWCCSTHRDCPVWREEVTDVGVSLSTCGGRWSQTGALQGSLAPPQHGGGSWCHTREAHPQIPW